MSNVFRTNDDFFKVICERVSDQDYRVILFPNFSYINYGTPLQTFHTEHQAVTAAMNYRDAMDIALQNGYSLDQQKGELIKEGTRISHLALLDRASESWSELLQTSTV
ncbi:hypothetical protein [Ammoniphilus sp. CFH 90114]|uniref:hypothetical protein n=1 Tax=Ammoniphilus sp. CFH 90114 TaxID=2493665 RepID=UPI00100F5981|nr:hypothetical protein [Ammoniphilus sp. CFH 90114]RXT06428.1 hypothetical protein EIZ39_15270 [Ammoniphilus sp. CFH 90114]